MYGGHITDDWDRRLCNTYLEEYMKPEQVSHLYTPVVVLVLCNEVEWLGPVEFCRSLRQLHPEVCIIIIYSCCCRSTYAIDHTPTYAGRAI